MTFVMRILGLSRRGLGRDRKGPIHFAATIALVAMVLQVLSPIALGYSQAYARDIIAENGNDFPPEFFQICTAAGIVTLGVGDDADPSGEIDRSLDRTCPICVAYCATALAPNADFAIGLGFSQPENQPALVAQTALGTEASRSADPARAPPLTN